MRLKVNPGGLKKFEIGECRPHGAIDAKKIPNVEKPVNMPTKKPRSLIVRHETAAEKAARAAHDAQFRSERALPMEAPARLNGHPLAEAAWRRLMREYSALDGEIVTRMDMDLLIDYCILIEQVHEMDELRKAALRTWEILDKIWIEDHEQWKAATKFEYVEKINDALDDLMKLDTRADRKRTLLLQLRQSLYLTPRARAGVAPKAKEKDNEPVDDMESLLNEVEEELNAGHEQ